MRTSDQSQSNGALRSLWESLKNFMTMNDYKKREASWLTERSPGLISCLDSPMQIVSISELVYDEANLLEEIHGYVSPQYTEQKVEKQITYFCSRTSLLNLQKSRK